MTKTPKRRGLLKNAVMLLVVAVAVVVVTVQLRKRALINQENQAVEYQNQGEYRQALEVYQALIPKVRGADEARIRTSIARCYVSLAENPGLGYNEALELYRKAYAHDSDAVTNPAIRKRLETTD